MMKKFTQFALFVLTVSMSAAAADKGVPSLPALPAATEWEFYFADYRPSAEELSDQADYKFGSQAGYLYRKFMSLYVVKEETVPGDPTRRTVIRKTPIYNAVRAIEKQLGRNLKNDPARAAAINDEFTYVLKVAISAFEDNSDAFEQTLHRDRKDVTALLTNFRKVKVVEL